MANYFKTLPIVGYDINGTLPNRYVNITNIMKRVKFKTDAVDTLSIYYPYYVQEGERPDIVSNKAYGTVAYTYLILLINNIVDPLFDWPLSAQQFESYIISKYGGVDIAQGQIEYYYKVIRPEVPKTEDQDRIPEVRYRIDQTTYNATSAGSRGIMYSYDHEVELNDAKREINLIRPDYIQTVDYEVKTKFRA